MSSKQGYWVPAENGYCGEMRLCRWEPGQQTMTNEHLPTIRKALEESREMAIAVGMLPEDHADVIAIDAALAALQPGQEGQLPGDIRDAISESLRKSEEDCLRQGDGHGAAWYAQATRWLQESLPNEQEQL